MSPERAAPNLNGTLTRTETAYDPLGRLFSRTAPSLPGDPSYETTFLYDGLGRLQQTNASLGDIDGVGPNVVAITLTSYQGSSVTTRQTVHGESQQRTETKNALGKIAWAMDALGNSAQYRYDSDGILTDVFDPSGNDVHTHYDSLGRKDSTTDPDMGTWQYCYDGFGNLVGQIDAKTSGSTCLTGPLTVAMTYDALGRMTSKTDVATGDTAQWLYDALPGAAPGAGVGPGIESDDRSPAGHRCLFQRFALQCFRLPTKSISDETRLTTINPLAEHFGLQEVCETTG
jgi:YD repeat-containing protein